MKAWNIYAVLLCLGWVVGMMSNLCCCQNLFDVDKRYVHVVNGLSGHRMLFVHCKSKDDDIGEHNLAVGTEISWSFKINFFATTLFWCYTRTDHQHATFNVFWAHAWLEDRCDRKTCIWTAKDDGFYLKNIPLNRDELIHKWEPDGNSIL